MKTLASIGAAALLVLILLYANGYFHSTDRMKGRNESHNTGQGTSEAQAEGQRLAQEEERLRTAREAERQRLAQEGAERQRQAQEAESQRLAQEEAERQPKAQDHAKFRRTTP